MFNIQNKNVESCFFDEDRFFKLHFYIDPQLIQNQTHFAGRLLLSKVP